MIPRLHRSVLGVLMIAALTLLASCDFPVPQPQVDVNATAAAQTLAVELATLSQGGVPTTAAPPTLPPSPLPTTAVPPTLTPTSTPTVTATPLPCDQAEWITDVNYPDGTDVAPGAAFTKIWRLRNTGTCTWTSSYSLVFDHGVAMGAPASVALTSGTVAPGQTVDVQVNLTAPAAPGTYQGFFRLRNPSGVIFPVTHTVTGNEFWVKIDVIAPTTSVTLPILTSEDGYVTSTGELYAFPNVGDTGSNVAAQAFASFDMSGIPAGATITNVTFNLTDYDTLGSPFADLGCLYLFKQDYGSVDASDFVPGSPAGGMIRICNTGALNASVSDDDFRTAVQSKVGSSRFQMRFHFTETAVSADGEADMVRFGDITMTVTYYTVP
jgi:hypothetical protein